MNDQALPFHEALSAAVQLANLQQETIAQLQLEIARLRGALTSAEQIIFDQRTEIRDLHMDAVLHQPRQLAGTLSDDSRTIAQALRDAGIPLRTIGAALGVSEKTIRNWTAEVLHIKEAA